MRRSLVTFVFALLLGASSLWLLNSDSGYILISLDKTTVEMTFWTGLFIVALSIALAVWLVLLVKWILTAGGLSFWWRNRQSDKQGSRTKQGLILYADQDWHRASELLSNAISHSDMPDVNLLFAAKAAAADRDTDQAINLLSRLKESHPKATLLANKALAEMLLEEEKFDHALDLLVPIHREKPWDTGVLRLLTDIYYLTENWAALQKLLADLRRFNAINKIDLDVLESDVYLNFVLAFEVDLELVAKEQRDQVRDLWEMIPRRLRQGAELTCAYFDILQKVYDAEKLADLLCKSINSHWNQELAGRLGRLKTTAPEKLLTVAEKWLLDRPQDSVLLATCANLCCQLCFWGKAQSYLSLALDIEPTPQLCLQLAEVLMEIGDPDGSQAMYRKGLRMAVLSD